MKNCYQSENQTILQHGFSVKNYLFDLLNHLKFNKPLKFEWKIPKWIYEYKSLLLSKLPSDKTLKWATILHDCGKPFCVEIDANGKRHFPNHSKISYEVFKLFSDDKIASELILNDMDIHLLKSDNFEKFLENPNCLIHILIGLSEIMSNALMFGGFESVSFKIKYKSFDKFGKRICKYFSDKN